MQIRSVYLPELRAPIVVRFQERGSDVIAEGEVAWRKVRANGGDFGVRFTALDSGSVQALKSLCGVEDPLLDGLSPAAGAETHALESEHDTEPLPPAAVGVKLHIGGLATPMHAQVRGQGRQTLEVGSPLEFLRIGRSLEVEDVVRGGRRTAQIDTVDVVIDEHSCVPELLVSLRYATPTDSPVPALTRAKNGESRSLRAASSASRDMPGSSRPGSASVRASEGAAGSNGHGSKAATSALTSETGGREAASGGSTSASSKSEPSSKSITPVTSVARGTERTLDDERDEGEDEESRAEADEAVAASSQSTEAAAESERSPETDPEALLRERLDGMLGGVSQAARAASAHMARFGGAASRGAGWLVARARSAFERSPGPPIPRRRTAAAPRALRPGMRPPGSTPPVQRSRSSEEQAQRPRSARGLAVGIGVGLFTIGLVLATRQPSQHGHTPAAARIERLTPATASAPTVAPSSEAARPIESAPTVVPAAAPSEPDTRRTPAPSRSRGSNPTGDDDSAQSALEGGRSSAKAESQVVEDFGQGRLTLPVVYRLRLDQAGGSLRGERTPTGFDVTIEGRRILDSAANIGDRDERIAKVALHNGSQGTRVSFRFRHTIPGYKVRLRKDYVEFLISSS
jgi:hypothetical protein